LKRGKTKRVGEVRTNLARIVGDKKRKPNEKMRGGGRTMATHYFVAVSSVLP
jgi:hypothetical protein